MSTAPAPQSVQRPSRWRQYSLRSLMVLTLLCALGLAIWTIYVEPYRRQQRLVERIGELEGMATTEVQPTAWSSVFGDQFFINIVQIGLHGAPIEDAWMANLRDTPRLRRLVLSRTRVGDGGMVRVAPLKELQSLSLSATRVTDTALTQIKDLRQLEQLYLENCPITDAGLSHVAGLTNLKILDLRGTKITDAGISQFSGLKRLNTLLLDNTDVTQACLAELTQLPKLVDVSASGTFIIAPALREAFPQARAQSKVRKALAEPTVLAFVETPLTDVTQYLTDYHQVLVWLDRRTMSAAGISEDTPITKSIRNKPLAEALQETLDSKGLKWVIRHGAITITTKDDAANASPRLILKEGETISRRLCKSLEAVMPIEVIEAPVSDVLAYASGKLNAEVRLADGAFEPAFGKRKITHMTYVPASNALELLFEELDVHGVIENDAIVVYPGPVP